TAEPLTSAAFLCPQPDSIAAITTTPVTLNQRWRAIRVGANDGWGGGIMNDCESGCVFTGVLMNKQ
ncbi:MAG: hypothetical protein ABSF34_17020, partial [Verrucomicrobiota bacterium]